MLEFRNFLLEIPSGWKVEINGQVSPNDVLCIRGPSGAGKTTVLRAIAGFRAPLSGHFFLNGTELTRTRPENRRSGYLFQGPQLIPAMTVEENLLFVLEIHHPDWSETLRRDRVRDALKHAAMDKLANHSVTTLSGGEAQRIAFCRVLLVDPAFFLLDEPFTGLDPLNRQFFRNWLKDELKLRQRPTVMVSHDASDAEDLGARIVEWPIHSDSIHSDSKISLRFS